MFLPAVFILSRLAAQLPFSKGPQLCVLLASLFFYAWARPSYLPYILGSIVVNWQLARMIAGATGIRRKRYLQLGLILNVSFLCTFKYFNFFISNFPWLVRHHIAIPDLAFPLGISFFTLAQVMYLVDCYEELLPASSLFDHATFVAFFPYVISGPISRAKRILHQFPILNDRTGPSSETIARAMFLFSLGLIKKVVLADTFSTVAIYAFHNISTLSIIEAVVGIFAYTLQLYFDFSGYSDMAIASAMFFGIEIPRNFDAPLRAPSIIEFWQRWHISLTAFITTYLYTPILRSFKRVSLATSGVATFIAMSIAGLWHGPSWTFVIFGAVHGVGLAVNQYWRKKKMPKLPRWFSWMLTFGLVELGLIFFRAPDFQSAILYLQHLCNWHNPFGTENLKAMDGVGLMMVIYLISQIAGIIAAFFGKSTDQLAREFQPNWVSYAAAAACAAVAFVYLNSNVAQPFLYFAF